MKDAHEALSEAIAAYVTACYGKTFVPIEWALVGVATNMQGEGGKVCYFTPVDAPHSPHTIKGLYIQGLDMIREQE